MRESRTVGLSDARRVIEAGEHKAEERGRPVNIAIVDVGGNLVAHIRMNGARIGTVDIAVNKGYTARATRTPPSPGPREVAEVAAATL